MVYAKPAQEGNPGDNQRRPVAADGLGIKRQTLAITGQKWCEAILIWEKTERKFRSLWIAMLCQAGTLHHR
jgi:hypothetical protein